MNTRDQEPLEDWEKKVHRDLNELPELEAPSTLIPGVLNRIQAFERAPWYRAAWWQWPPAARAVSVLVVLALLGALAWLSGWLGELGLARQLARVGGELKELMMMTLDASGTVLGSSSFFWRDYGQILLLAAAAFLTATYLTCVAAGTALYQLAWKRTL